MSILILRLRKEEVLNSTEKFLSSLHPFPPQEEFFKATNRRIAYGGARGGGKSYAMRSKLVLLALNYSGIQILLLRRTFPELRENHINPLRKLTYGFAKYKESTKELVFNNGSRIKLGYLNDEYDILQYQGQSYEVVAMEEATQFTESQYYALTECCRLSGNMKVPFTPRMYFTCNPGGVGHAWVKRLFIDRDFRENEDENDYLFIPSTVFDNEYMLKNNPEYVRNLESLPPLRRKAMLYGDWDAFEGQYFTEFSREKHVISPFTIPNDWIKFASLDYGLDMTACLWLAYPQDLSRIVVFREFYMPNLILSEAAKEISKLSKEEKIRYITASPDLAGRRQDSGSTGFDIMRNSGLRGLIPANNERINGWRRIREFLKTNDNEPAFLQIFSTCKNLIRTLPKLCFDSKTAEDVSLTPHELTHAPDALRYALSSLNFLPNKEISKKESGLTIREQFFGKRNENEYFDFLKN